MDLAHPAPGEPRELTLGPGDQLWLDPIALMEVAQEPEPVLAPEPTPAGRPAHQPLPVHAPAMIWPARPMVGDRQGPQEVHLTLRKAAGPVGPAPIPSPFDPDPGPFSSLPAAGGEVEEESQQPAAVGRDFSLSELLNGRVRD